MKLDNIEATFIDFDGTLIQGQSQMYLIKYLKDKKFISPFKASYILIWFVLYKLGLVYNSSKILNYALSCFKGMKEEDVQAQIDIFVEKILLNKMYKYSKDLIDFFKQKNIKVIVLSAAVEPIIKSINAVLQATDTVSTQVEVIDGFFTGKVIGLQVYGGNKSDFVHKYCTEHKINPEKILAIADHETDLNLLINSKIGIIANPNKKMYKLASQLKLPMLYLERDEPVQYFKFDTLSK